LRTGHFVPLPKKTPQPELHLQTRLQIRKSYSHQQVIVKTKPTTQLKFTANAISYPNNGIRKKPAITPLYSSLSKLAPTLLKYKHVLGGKNAN